MKASCLLMQTQKILWGASKSIKTPSYISLPSIHVKLHRLDFGSGSAPG